MRRLVPTFLLGLLSCSAASLAVLAVSGCGGGDAAKDGAQVTIPPEEIQAQNAMEDFMKSQQKKKR